MLIAILLILGLALSAFFSGSETGFYRVTRVRLVMDAKSGKWISKALLWLSNHSTVLVATVLIGNNIANYLVSLGLLLAGQRLFSDWGAMQSLLPLLATPVLFVYGELLPKYLYYQVPYRLLNFGAPLMIVCTLAFLPISFIVIALESVWQKFLGTNSIKTGSSLERQELQRVLVEGQEAGVLLPVQRELAQNMFTYGVRPVRQFATPLRAVPLVSQQADKSQVLERADSEGSTIVGVWDDDQKRLAGCYIVADLLISQEPQLTPLPICRVFATESNIQVLIKLQGTASPIAAIEYADGRTLGIVEKERLMSLLLSESS